MVIMGFLAVTVRLVSYGKEDTIEQGVETVRQIPMDIGEWRGTDHVFDPIVYDILETKAILHRSYKNRQGQEVFLSLVYYQETKVDFHAPEGCLGGQGIKTEKTPSILNIVEDSGKTIALKVNKLIQHQDNHNILVYYFYKTGAYVGRNYIKLRLNLVLNKFKETQNSGSLIRVSTPLLESDDGRISHDALESFTSSLFPYLTKYL